MFRIQSACFHVAHAAQYLCVSTSPQESSFRDSGLPLGLSDDVSHWTEVAKRGGNTLSSWGKTSADTLSGFVTTESKAFSDYLQRRANMILKWVQARGQQATSSVSNIGQRSLVDDDDDLAPTMPKGYACAILPPNAAKLAMKQIRGQVAAPRQSSFRDDILPSGGHFGKGLDGVNDLSESLIEKITDLYGKLFEKMFSVFRKNIKQLHDMGKRQ